FRPSRARVRVGTNFYAKFSPPHPNLPPSRGKQLSFVSSEMKGFVPLFSGSDHGIQDRQEFAHAGDDRDFLRLAGSEQSLVETLDDAVVAHGNDGRHIQRAADLGATAKDHTFATHLARVAIERR